MPNFKLRMAAADDVSAVEAASSLYWLTGQRSSFTPGIGPSLGAFGPVPDLNIDVVRIALTAFAADRSVPRVGQGSNWNRRELDLEIPVSDPARWATVANEFADVLGFLSGDHWTLSFTEEEAPVETVSLPDASGVPKRVVLLSGGADSAIGSLFSRSSLAPEEHHVLLSHFSNNAIAPIQRRVAEEIERQVPGPTQQHIVVHLGRRSERIDGTLYPTEPTSRSRSLLFIALGLAVASIHGVPLWIPENGFASLNPPLGPERLGSLSTRTTHPAFLQGLSSLLTTVGAHGAIENPFAFETKGEMYQRVVEMIGGDATSSFLSSTHSCGLTGQRAHHFSSDTHCGVCFGCVLRRASFAASGVTDTTNYIAPSKEPSVQRWLDGKSVEQQVRNFIRRGIRPRDIVTLGLPDNYPTRHAMELCQRGITELRSLYT